MSHPSDSANPFDSANPPELPREMTEFLTELSNALQKHAMYPEGHPMLATAADGVIRRLGVLLEDRPAIALGVSPDRLLIAGMASDPSVEFLREFAGRLHRRNIGAVKFYRGVEPREIIEALGVMCREADPAAVPEESLMSRRWPHIRMHALSYGQLELLGEPGQASSGVGSWAARLWLDLARAAMEQETDQNAAPPDPTQVARAIDARREDPSYTQRIVGFFTDLTDTCKARGGSDALALQGYMSRLVCSMAPDTLTRLMELEANNEQRRKFMVDVSQTLAVDAVLDLVQAAAAASARSLSPALVQLLTKLSIHAEKGSSDVRGRAESAFREQVRDLMKGWEEWEENDPAPAEYRRTLRRLPAVAPAIAPPKRVQLCEPSRIVSMSLEVGVVTTATRRAVDGMVEDGKIVEALALLDRAPNLQMAQELSRQLVTLDVLRQLLAARPIEWGAARRLTAAIGPDASGVLFDALVAAPDPETRTAVVEQLASFGAVAGPEAVARLVDASWPVQRSLLGLLAMLSVVPEGFSGADFIDHTDGRVRNDALRILLGGAATRNQALCHALSSSDSNCVRLGLLAARESCPPAAVPLIVRQLAKGDLDPMLEAIGIRAMSPVAVPITLDTLAAACLTRPRWFRRQRLVARSPVLLAALNGLATYWRKHSKARAVLDLAAASPDAEIHAAVASRSTGP